LYSVIISLGAGSTLLAFLITYQVKVAGTDLLSIAKYNLVILPAIFIANVFLGMGINKGHAIFENLPLMIAIQTSIYYIMITVFSIYMLDNKISIAKTIVAFALIIVAIYLLKS